jgi:hypothetical protein
MKITNLLLAINSLLILFAIGAAIYIGSYVKMDNARHQEILAFAKDTPQNGINKKNGTAPQIKPAAKQAVAETAAMELTIEGGTVSPQIIPVYGGQTLEIKIANNEKETHTILIEELGFDSGTIAPGETKQVKIGPLPEKLGIYEYKSMGGAKEFKGSLIIIENK